MALVGFFRDHGEEMEVGGLDPEPGFLACLADGALEGRFPECCFELAADRTPCAGVGLAGAEDEEMFAAAVFDKNEDGDLVRENGGGGGDGRKR